jgi:hypothetical protein
MIEPKKSETYRAQASRWLARAAFFPEDSWDRERLETAARLATAFADAIERRNWRKTAAEAAKDKS